jgi:hypothetical protein
MFYELRTDMQISAMR